MGKIAKEIFTLDLLRKGEKLPKSVAEGIEKGVFFYVKADNYHKRYILVDFEKEDYKKIWEQISSNFSNFNKYLPKFGKFEVENFIESKFLHALVITKNFTDLFNMEIYFSDYNTTRITSEYLKERLLPCFEIKEVVNQTTYMKFKWEVLN